MRGPFQKLAQRRPLGAPPIPCNAFQRSHSVLNGACNVSLPTPGQGPEGLLKLASGRRVIRPLEGATPTMHCFLKGLGTAQFNLAFHQLPADPFFAEYCVDLILK